MMVAPKLRHCGGYSQAYGHCHMVTIDGVASVKAVWVLVMVLVVMVEIDVFLLVLLLLLLLVLLHLTLLVFVVSYT